MKAKLYESFFIVITLLVLLAGTITIGILYYKLFGDTGLIVLSGVAVFGSLWWSAYSHLDDEEKALQAAKAELKEEDRKNGIL